MICCDIWKPFIIIFVIVVIFYAFLMSILMIRCVEIAIDLHRASKYEADIRRFNVTASSSTVRVWSEPVADSQ